MILFFGPTGAGKSMQGQMMAVRMDWKWLSTGEMLRSSQDPKVTEVLKSGELVSDELTFEVFQKAIEDAKERNFTQVIVDGFPRTREQAEWLASYMDQSHEGIDLVVVLEVPESEITQRLQKRARMEDTPETIARRMTIYRQKMYPVLGKFAEDGVKIVHVDGTGSAGEVHDRIYEATESVCQD